MSDSLKIHATAEITAEHEPGSVAVQIYGENRDCEPSCVMVDLSQCERLGRFLLSKSPVPSCDIDAELFGEDTVDFTGLMCVWNKDSLTAEVFATDDSDEVGRIELSMFCCKLLHAWIGKVISRHSSQKDD